MDQSAGLHCSPGARADVAQACLSAAPVVVGLRNARLSADRLVEVLDRALVLVKIAVGKTPPVVGLVHFRIDADRFVVIGNRLLVPPGFLEPQCLIEGVRCTRLGLGRGAGLTLCLCFLNQRFKGFLLAWIKLEGFLEITFRRGISVEIELSYPSGTIRRSQSRIDGNRLIVVLNRTLVLPKTVIGITPVVVGFSIARVDSDRLVVVLDRTLVLPKIVIAQYPGCCRRSA